MANMTGALQNLNTGAIILGAAMGLMTAFDMGGRMDKVAYTMLGSAVTGGLSMLFGCTLAAPLGGIFAIFIPGVVGNLVLYIPVIAIGMVLTAVAVGFTKSLGRSKRLEEPAATQAEVR